MMCRPTDYPPFEDGPRAQGTPVLAQRDARRAEGASAYMSPWVRRALAGTLSVTAPRGSQPAGPAGFEPVAVHVLDDCPDTFGCPDIHVLTLAPTRYSAPIPEAMGLSNEANSSPVAGQTGV